MIILGIGSNLNSKHGDRFQNIDFVLSILENNKIKIIKKSSFYETPSYPNKNNPRFINIITIVETKFSPIDLMSELILIEKKMGRKRIHKNEPRICDIDIIDYNSEILNFRQNNYNLIIPHKELVSRNFVLYPLQEILPHWKHPKTNEKVSTLIQKLSFEVRKSILKIEKH